MKYNFDLELTRNNSLLLMLEQIKKKSVVLEFGPANGRMTKYLNKQLECKIYLAEIDEEAGKEALLYGEDLVVGDVENMEWFDKYQNIKFDYIIFADVLEHLRNPLEILSKSKMLLKNDGSILLSVPNFAHNSILINLMNDNFEYRNTGLLDNTHIHMFTKNSLEKMLSDADLYPCKRMATYADTQQTEISTDINSVIGVDSSVWNLRPYGEVYQFVYEVKKGNEYICEECNYLSKNRSKYFLQVFFNNGKYSEENSVKKHLESLNEEKIFTINIEPDIEIFRIDPLNKNGIFDIEVFGISESGRKKLTCIETNAKYRIADTYCFDTSDPCMVYMNNKYANIEIKVIFYLSDDKSIKLMDILQQKFGDKFIPSYDTQTKLEELLTKNLELQLQINKLKEEMKQNEISYSETIENIKKKRFF